MKFFENLKCNLKKAAPMHKATAGALITIMVVTLLFAALEKSPEVPEPPSTPLITKQAPITAAEAATLTRQAAATRGKATPISREADCNIRVAAISNEVRALAQAGVDAAIFTYGPADVSHLPSLDGISMAFDSACVDTASEVLKSRGFNTERTVLSPTEGTGHLIVRWGDSPATKQDE